MKHFYNKALKIILMITTLVSLFAYAISLENYLDNYPKNPNLKIQRCKKDQCSCLDLFSKFRKDCPNTKANLCFESAECRIQKTNGFCGFTFSKSLRQCLNKANYCKVGGWYNELCVKGESKTVQGPNIPRPENVCFKEAKCEVQLTGNCGWTKTRNFKKCIEKYIGN